jgi:cytochrome d ubiquinol oxidase subunit I
MAGLDTVARSDWPSVPIVFWSFRIMVGIGLAMLALGMASLIARSFRKLYKSRPLHWAALIMAPSGILAVIAGWVTTEVGRQPYTIYKLLRTTESASPLDAPAVASSLAAFAVVYFIVFGAGMFYVLRLMGQPPHAHESGLKTGAPTRSAGITPAPAMAAEKEMKKASDHGA